MIISVVNQKGGVGKTTVAINLAAMLKRNNFNLVLLDADPQGSATQWHDVEENQAIEVIHHPDPVRPTDIEALLQRYDHIVIDAPPAIGEISRSVLTVSDLTIVPLSPSPLDIWSCWGTLEMISEVQRENPDLKAQLLVSRKIPGTRVGREAREAMEVFETEIFQSELCQRVAYVDSMTSGVSVMQYAPGSKAMREIEGLFEEISPGMLGRKESEGLPAEALERDSEPTQLPRWQSMYSA
jgi:chromosome partitioning protein